MKWTKIKVALCSFLGLGLLLCTSFTSASSLYSLKASNPANKNQLTAQNRDRLVQEVEKLMSQVGSWRSSSGEANNTVIQNIKNELEKKIDQTVLAKAIQKIQQELLSIRNEINKKSWGSIHLSAYAKKSDLDNYVSKSVNIRSDELSRSLKNWTYLGGRKRLWDYTFCALTSFITRVEPTQQRPGREYFVFDCRVQKESDGWYLYTSRENHVTQVCWATCF